MSILLFSQISFEFLFPTLTQVTWHSLLRPLEFHSGLHGESLHHSLMLLGEGGHGAGVERGHGRGEGTLDLFGAGIPHKQLVIHNAQTGGKIVPEATEQVDNPHTTTNGIHLNDCHSAVGFLPYPRWT